MPDDDLSGGCFTNVSRALQNNLAKIYNARNNISVENFKLKLCTGAQSMALVTRTEFQLEILIRSAILVIYKFRENILESSRNVSETPLCYHDHYRCIGTKYTIQAIISYLRANWTRTMVTHGSYHLPLVPHICVSVSGQHWFRYWLVAYSASSHYLNQCWVIFKWTLRNKLEWNCNQNTQLFIHKNASEYIVCEMAAILSRGRLVNIKIVVPPMN